MTIETSDWNIARDKEGIRYPANVRFCIAEWIDGGDQITAVVGDDSEEFLANVPLEVMQQLTVVAEEDNPADIGFNRLHRRVIALCALIENGKVTNIHNGTDFFRELLNF